MLKQISRLSLLIAVVLLSAGFVDYALFALGERPDWFVSFFLCMSSLFFFNLPHVLKKRAARKRLQPGAGKRDKHQQEAD